MAGTTLSPLLKHAVAVLLLAVPIKVFAQPETAPTTETVALSVEGISSASSEDNPGILYILPWQPPTLPRRTRGALEPNASELLEPVDPVVFERHQNFQQSLNPVLDSTNALR